jgi:hypothetical protein
MAAAKIGLSEIKKIWEEILERNCDRKSKV